MTHLDDRQLKDKLAKASSDMPHVDLWPRLRQDAAEIAVTSQRRRRGAGFSPFAATRLFAPAFALMVVVMATLTSMQGYRERTATPTPDLTVVTHVTAPVAVEGIERSEAHERWMNNAEARVRQAVAGMYTTTTGQGLTAARDTEQIEIRREARQMRVALLARPTHPIVLPVEQYGLQHLE